MRSQTSAAWHLTLSCILGVGFFAMPIPWNGHWTVVFDVVVKALIRGRELPVGLYCLLVIGVGAVGSVAARTGVRWARAFEAPWGLTALRVSGVFVALAFFTGVGPAWLHEERVGGLMWTVLAFSVGVIIPLGAVVLNVMVSYGLIELVGTWMRPLMRPLFGLPGRAAVDDLMSWLGSYSVGLYVTRKLTDDGRYTRRESYIIVTCFSTVSVGFVGVVASTLDLLPLFSVIFASYFGLVYLLAAILARTWPVTSIPNVAIGIADPEPEHGAAWERAMTRARSAPPMFQVCRTGLVDGLFLTSSVLGTIVTVGTAALFLAYNTPVFSWMGAPLVPVLDGLGLPDAEMLAPAVVAGITEMYIPAILAKDAAIQGRFFICVLSISQVIFFSSVAPMMLDMFRDLPITIWHLLALFVIRTALLVPLIAALTWTLDQLGVFGLAM
jgi:nucleoside recognition membrane protein YjiH